MNVSTDKKKIADNYAISIITFESIFFHKQQTKSDFTAMLFGL